MSGTATLRQSALTNSSAVNAGGGISVSGTAVLDDVDLGANLPDDVDANGPVTFRLGTTATCTTSGCN